MQEALAKRFAPVLAPGYIYDIWLDAEVVVPGDLTTTDMTGSSSAHSDSQPYHTGFVQAYTQLYSGAWAPRAHCDMVQQQQELRQLRLQQQRLFFQQQQQQSHVDHQFSPEVSARRAENDVNVEDSINTEDSRVAATNDNDNDVAQCTQTDSETCSDGQGSNSEAENVEQSSSIKTGDESENATDRTDQVTDDKDDNDLNTSTSEAAPTNAQTSFFSRYRNLINNFLWRRHKSDDSDSDSDHGKESKGYQPLPPPQLVAFDYTSATPMIESMRWTALVRQMVLAVPAAFSWILGFSGIMTGFRGNHLSKAIAFCCISRCFVLYDVFSLFPLSGTDSSHALGHVFRLKLVENYVESQHHPLSTIRVALDLKDVIVPKATLHIVARFQ